MSYLCHPDPDRHVKVIMPTNPLAADLDHILRHTGDLWDELRGERLFITGGTGFFGCWLLESLLWANQHFKLRAQAVILTRRPAIAKQALPHLMLDPAITLLGGDVRTFAFPTGQFSHIIHAATESNATARSEDPVHALDTIVNGTRRTLDFALHCHATKLLLTSSGAVYGRQPSNLSHIPEEYAGAPDPFDPGSAYGQGKRLAEHLCTQYAHLHALQPKVARCFAFVGPYLPLNTDFAIGNFIRDALAGGPIVVSGDGTPLRSYLYASDLAIWLWTILFRGKSLRPYNVGSESSISIAGLATLVAGTSSPASAIIIDSAVPAGFPAERYVPSTKSARDDLGLTQLIDLEPGILKTFKWCREVVHACS
jgi:nucleoside-diphosphate-sugar epimerase